MLRFALCSLAGLLLCAAQLTVAQSFPSRTMRVLVASPPGNPSDIVMRAAAKELSSRFGVPVIVDNRVGANEIIMQEACAKAPSDGHTLCLVSKDGMSYNPNVYAKLPYDPDKDYKPVARMYFLISTLAATGSLPVNSIGELRELATAKPGSLNFGTRGVGSNQDIFRQWLGIHWKTEFAGIHYKGTNFIFNALVAGEIHLTLGSLGNIVSLLQGGKAKLLAVEMSKRSPVMPQVPTFDEAGFEAWPGRPFWGIVVPANTPNAIASRLNAELVWLSREPKFVQFMEARYLELAVGTPEEFASFLQSDREKIGQLVRKFNISTQ